MDRYQYSFLPLSTSHMWKWNCHEQNLVLNPEAAFIHVLLLRLWSANQHWRHQDSVGNLESQGPHQTYCLKNLCCIKILKSFVGHCLRITAWIVLKSNLTTRGVFGLPLSPASESLPWGQLWERFSKSRCSNMVSRLFQRHQSLYPHFKNLSSSQIMGYQSLNSEDDKTKQVSPRQKWVLTQTYSYFQRFHRNYVKKFISRHISCYIKLELTQDSPPFWFVNSGM